MPFLDVPRGSIHYETSGESGPWVTLINGHTRSLRDFKLMSKALVEAGFRVLMMDNRGSGESRHDAPFTIVDMANDVERLWDEVKIIKTHLLGISMGGMISQCLAAERKEQVTKLVLVSTAATRSFIHDHAEMPWGTSKESVKEKLAFYFAPSFLSRNKLLVDAMAKQILTGISEGEFSAGASAQREAMADFDGSLYLSKISCPTLILHGSHDRIMDPQAARELEQGIHDATLTEFPDAGHLLLAEAAKPLYEQVIAFLKS